MENRGQPSFSASLIEELKAIASRCLDGERMGHTLQTTALVNEAYLKLGQHRQPFADRVHFLAAAATAMRRILVDHARTRDRQKRGDGVPAITLQTDSGRTPAASLDLLDLERALVELESLDERKAKAIELHYFAGLEYAEIADVLGVSSATIKRDLTFARAWIGSRLT